MYVILFQIFLGDGFCSKSPLIPQFPGIDRLDPTRQFRRRVWLSAPTAFAKDGGIDSGWSVPTARTIARAELHGGLLVAVWNLQGRVGCGIREPRRGAIGLTPAGPAFLRRIGRISRLGREFSTALCARRRLRFGA